MILKLLVAASLFIAIISLAILVIKAFSFGRKPFYAEPQGKVSSGINYAFVRGMMPWEKESAGKHLPTYFSGIIYHSGIFAGILYLFLVILEIKLPFPIITLMKIIFAFGLISGISLLLKRLISAKMRFISCGDDYGANLIVDIFLALSLAHTFWPGVAVVYYIGSIMMFLYMPLGKIRHCFFFFYVRILFGVFFGRRRIFPAQRKV